MARYVPPHRRADEPTITPDDSVSVVAAEPSPSSLDITLLTSEQLSRVFKRIGLGKYAQLAIDTPLRGCDLVHCSLEDLEACGIAFRPHRVSILASVKKWTEEGVPVELFDEDDDAGAGVGGGLPLANKEDDSVSVVSSTPTWLNDAQLQLQQPPPVPQPAAERGPSSPTATSVSPPPSSAASTASAAAAATAATITAPDSAPTNPKMSDMTPAELSMLDVIAARFEGLDLRSNAGTAVRAVQAGEQARQAVHAKWRPREPGPPA